MGRALTVAAQTAIDGSHVPCAILIELYFPSGTVRFCNAGHALEWGGNSYLGAGAVSGLEPITETVTPTALALNLRFSGIDPGYLSAILADAYQGHGANIYLALLDDELRIVSDPVLVFQGRMDEPEIQVGDTATIQLSLENRMADWDRPRLRRYNHADQVARYPGDLAFEYVEGLQDANIVWGIYKGPVAPDPVKIFNRTLDRVVNFKIKGIPIAPGAKLVINAGRKIGDTVADWFGW